jgi:hypothetical protein
MIFALLTLLSSLSLAAVSGWFSIAGIMTIYAGAPTYALAMGIVAEAAKLVTTSWLYRNWEYSSWRLKLPLIYFTIALMIITSIGVYGFLSKAHLDQGANTIDNSAKIERLNYQIDREKTSIIDAEKVISQLDATVNSFLGKDRTDKSLAVRRSQATQRKQLRKDIDESQKRIDTLSNQKLQLDSELRKVQLEVGPIRYIAELFYGTVEDSTKNIESAVRLFTLLIVSTLDPLAVILLVAANHTLIRLRNEKKKVTAQRQDTRQITSEESNVETSDTVQDCNKQVEENGVLSTTVCAYPAESICNTILQGMEQRVNEKEDTTSFKINTDADKTEQYSTLQAVCYNVDKTGVKIENKDYVQEYTAQDMPANDPGIINEETNCFIQNDNKARLGDGEIRKFREETETTLGQELLRKKTDRVLANTEEAATLHEVFDFEVGLPLVSLPVIRSPILTRVNDSIVTPDPVHNPILREIIGTVPHFDPKRVNEEEKIITPDSYSQDNKEISLQEESTQEQEKTASIPLEGQAAPAQNKKMEIRQDSTASTKNTDKYPAALSWLTEFKRS